MSFFNKIKTDIESEEPKKTPESKKDDKKVKPREEKKPEKEDSKAKPKKEAKDWLKSEGQLAVDVFQTDSEFCVEAPIAGVDPENIDVSVENEMLVIKGERKAPDNGAKEKNYFYQECYWGPFSRQIILSEDADTNRIKANLKKGVLMIKIPRVSRIKKKKVTVMLGE